VLDMSISFLFSFSFSFSFMAPLEREGHGCIPMATALGRRLLGSVTTVR